MTALDQRLIAWVSTQVMPHEPAVRAWLRRSMVSPEDADDLIQEAYAALAGLDAFDQIARPDGYFFQIVRNLLTDQLRRARIVRIESVAEMDTLKAASDEPSPERVTAAKRELEMVQRVIAGLPERCRRIFEMRKINGLSQREIAARLKVSESIVENDGVKGMRLIMQAMRESDPVGVPLGKTRDGHAAKRG